MLAPPRLDSAGNAKSDLASVGLNGVAVIALIGPLFPAAVVGW